MAEKRDYYEVLGVSKSASKDEIKSAWRKLAKTYHPDNKETGNEAKFKEIQEAYDVLYDDQKRAAYDQFGHAAFENGAAGGGAGGFGGFNAQGFEDIDLGDIFGSFFGGGRRRSNPRGPQRGNDSLLGIKISFMDAINGKRVKVNVTYDQPCPSCGGSGAKSSNDIETCSRCHGTGTVKTRQQSFFGGIIESQSTCPDCGGTGKKIKEKCPDCGGKGYKKVKTEIEVNIPAGIASGQQIRIPGKGERGINGGANGDLYLEVQIENHQYFKRDGNDIHLEVPISMVDAALGITITVPTVYGDIEVKVPEGTQPGQILKIRGKGVKDLRTGIQGDQYIHLDVKTPTKLTKEQKDLLSKFAGLENKSDSLIDRFKNKFKK